jgi:peptidoglycan/xylan/chitin deacetylase (PgdA/CDA1 family)
MQRFPKKWSSSILLICISACITTSRRTSDEKVLEKNLIARLPLSPKQLILTFDDGPGELTGDLLDFLKEKQISATFFVTGSIARNNLRLLERMYLEGHTIGNHTYGHKIPMPTGSTLINDMLRAHQLIQPFSKTNTYFFRPPGGAWDSNDARATEIPEFSKYIGPVFWDIGGALENGYSADWDCWRVGISSKECAAGYVREAAARGKGIVLLHDIHRQSVNMFINDLYPALIKQGFSFVSLEKANGIPDRIRKFGGKPLGEDGVIAPVPNHPPVIIPPEPTPICTDSPDPRLLSDVNQKFSMTHGTTANTEKFQAVVQNLINSPKKFAEYDKKWFVRHSASDSSNMAFVASRSDELLTGARYNLNFGPPGSTIPFKVEWQCDKWVGSFDYRNGAVEILEIIPFR